MNKFINCKIAGENERTKDMYISILLPIRHN